MFSNENKELLKEHEDKLKEYRLRERLRERKLKRIIGVLLIICVVSVGTNTINAWRSYHIRQDYMQYIWHDLRNLEILMGHLYFSIEAENNDRIGHTLNRLSSTAKTLSLTTRMFSYHQNFHEHHVPDDIFRFQWYVPFIVSRIKGSQATTEDITAFSSLLNSWAEELRELNADISVEREELWQGETITVRGPNFRMSTRRFLTRIDTSTANINNELLEHIGLHWR